MIAMAAAEPDSCATCTKPLVRDNVRLVIFVTVLTREQIDANDAADDAGENVDIPDALLFCRYQCLAEWAEARE